jgi:hypothetical protein
MFLRFVLSIGGPSCMAMNKGTELTAVGRANRAVCSNGMSMLITGGGTTYGREVYSAWQSQCTGASLSCF